MSSDSGKIDTGGSRRTRDPRRLAVRRRRALHARGAVASSGATRPGDGNFLVTRGKGLHRLTSLSLQDKIDRITTNASVMRTRLEAQFSRPTRTDDVAAQRKNHVHLQDPRW